MSLLVLSNQYFGPIGPGLCLGCYGSEWSGHGPFYSFGPTSGLFGPVLYPHQLRPSPCVRIAWAKAMINPTTDDIPSCPSDVDQLNLSAVILGVFQ